MVREKEDYVYIGFGVQWVLLTMVVCSNRYFRFDSVCLLKFLKGPVQSQKHYFRDRFSRFAVKYVRFKHAIMHF